MHRKERTNYSGCYKELYVYFFFLVLLLRSVHAFSRSMDILIVVAKLANANNHFINAKRWEQPNRFLTNISTFRRAHQKIKKKNSGIAIKFPY